MLGCATCDLLLITIHISDCRQFSDIHILQGSAATYLRCGGIFKYDLLQIYPWTSNWRDFQNRLTFGEVMGKSLVYCFFDSRCIWWKKRSAVRTARWPLTWPVSLGHVRGHAQMDRCRQSRDWFFSFSDELRWTWSIAAAHEHRTFALPRHLTPPGKSPSRTSAPRICPNPNLTLNHNRHLALITRHLTLIAPTVTITVTPQL